MKIVLAADVFPPQRSSGAVQLDDLSREFHAQGHEITVLVPSPGLAGPFQLEDRDGVEVLRLRAPDARDWSYLVRAASEFLLPFAMWRNLRRSPLSGRRWDGVVWYSPTIFLGPLASALRRASDCPGYLIVRDIFPDWAVDVGLLKRGLAYRLLKFVESYQYSVANVIGVQSPGNLAYFPGWPRAGGGRVEVLQNWLSPAPNRGCAIEIQKELVGRRLFVYAGNMGVAQGLEVILDLAQHLQHRDDVGFLLVGRGSDLPHLKRLAEERGLSNVQFADEIPPADIPGLYELCDFGLVILDPRHRTHNIPGKFLSYMQHGLPVLASINPGNDLADLILIHDVGRVSSANDAEHLERLVDELIAQVECDPHISARCRQLADELFSPASAVRQIVDSLQGTRNA